MGQRSAGTASNFAADGDSPVLSQFIVQRDDGLHVRLHHLPAARDFFDFVTRVFVSGYYFRTLDYARFVSLLFAEPASGDEQGAPQDCFLAVDIAPFRQQRQALYSPLRVENDEAFYLFEPLYVGADDDSAAATGDDAAARRESLQSGEIRVHLDVDEFVAHAWAYGVRFGIDLDVVRAGMALDKVEKLLVARGRPPVPGRDAEIQELAPGLHRNNAPRRLLRDRVDLRQFETRYPQVAVGVRLIRKMPSVPGVAGRALSGEPLPAAAPKDLDLASLAGPGTAVRHEKDGDYLVASVCGFLSIDTRTNQFSVGDKIVSWEGVSTRTTGDLLLTGEVYEQHGEIQEKRVVRCRSIVAHADVFGQIESAGGLVELKQNLVGGSASNEEGDICVRGLASGAMLTALHGCVTLQRADNCLIRARRIVVAQATNCDCLADEMEIEFATACALAGRSLHVSRTRARREVGNVLLVLLPDLAAYHGKIGALREKQNTLTRMISSHREKAATLRNDPEVARYLVLAGKLRRKEATLTPDQEVGWRRLAAAVAPRLRALTQLGETADAIESESALLAVELEETLAARADACTGLTCAIDGVEGETRVAALSVRSGETLLAALSPKELRIRLRAPGSAARTLFAGSSGCFSWRFEPPAP